MVANSRNAERPGWPLAKEPGFVGHAESGFQKIWTVSPHYTITQGILAEDRPYQGGRAYSPAADPSLPGELARLHRGEIKILEFVSLFGLLGYAHIFPRKKRVKIDVPVDDPLGGDPGKKREKVDVEVDDFLGGDPVIWVMEHAHIVSVLLELIGLMEERDIYGLSETLKELPAEPFWMASSWEKKDLLRDPLNSARQIAEILINRNISGISRQLSGGVLGFPSRSCFEFRAMIEVVYWQLADKLERGGVRRCKDCGHFFVSRDKRQWYCPAPNGLKRSRCASRSNVRAHRERQRDRENYSHSQKKVRVQKRRIR